MVIIEARNGELRKSAPQEKGDDSQFPIGMRVLAIDANIVCLKYLVHLLHKCRYKVTSTTEAAEAIRLLRADKEAFDIVITDVVRADMDGFKLLQAISREVDIPVVLISANDEVEMVKRGVMEGAQAYLGKPVRLQEIRTVWQHVLRKKLQKKSEEIIKPCTGKRARCKEENETRNTAENCASASDLSMKKTPRVTWSKELHLKFLDAYEQLGEKERVPNNILKLMNIPNLTRGNVASHLQKHREGLRKKKATDGNGAHKIPANSSVIFSSINQSDRTPHFTSSSISSFFSNPKPQIISATGQFPLLHLAGGESGRGSTIPPEIEPPFHAGDYFPAPEFKRLHFPAGILNPKPYDGFLGLFPDPDLTGAHVLAPNDIVLDSLHPISHSTAKTLRISSIENVSEISEQPPSAWPFPSNIIGGEYLEDRSAECFGVEFEKGSSSRSLHRMNSLMADDLSKIINQISSSSIP